MGHDHDQATDTPADPAEFWEARYRERPQIWSGKVNATLVAAVEHLEPGRALDLGCGEGGDALWLAERGWTVVAVDIAQVALDRGAARAAEEGLAARITWERHDLGESLPDGPFDLVAAQFLQSPVELPRIDVLARAAELLAPGGTLLAVSHAAPPPWASMPAHMRFPQPDEELAALDLDDRWEVVRAEVVERDAVGPDGQAAVLLDGVLEVRRAR